MRPSGRLMSCVPLDAAQRFHVARGRRSISDLDLNRPYRFALASGIALWWRLLLRNSHKWRRGAVSPAARIGKQQVHQLLPRCGLRKVGHVWPHMLRHSCGYHLANRRTTSGTRTSRTRHVTRAPALGGSRGCGTNPPSNEPRPLMIDVLNGAETALAELSC